MPENDSSLGDAIVQRVDPTADAQWDADVAGCPGATFFHGASWARVLQSTYGFTPVYYAIRRSGRIEALLPMMEIDSWLTGRRGVSLPFTDECSPICADADSFRRLYQQALAYAKSQRWRHIECRGGLPLFDNAPPSISFLGHRLDLRRTETELFARCEGSVRRAVRKAEQSGLTIEFSRDLEAVRAFYGLLCMTRKRHGVPPQPFEFFANIHRHVLVQGQGWVVLARLRERAVAGAIFFDHYKTATYKFGASDVAYQHLRANNLVMWESIRHYAREGFENLEFGRTSLSNAGLQNFKLSWGTTEYRIDYVRHDLRKDAVVVVGDKASGLHTRAFGLLPQPILNMIGFMLYKHID